MSARSAAARSPHRSRSTVAPRIPRRVSGPVARPTVALPAPRPRIALPELHLLDRLLRSRGWIWLIGVALMGIVAMQVSLLKLNTGISRAVQATTTLERQNAQLEGEIARLSSPERIAEIATRRGMVAPPAGSVTYVRVRSDDARRAVHRMQPPSASAQALMANGGRAPGGLPADQAVAPVTQTAVPVTTTTTAAPVDAAATSATPPQG